NRSRIRTETLLPSYYNGPGSAELPKCPAPRERGLGSLRQYGTGGIDMGRTPTAITAGAAAGPESRERRLACLRALERKVLWLSSWMIHHANHLRLKADGLKVGGHQASSASVVTLMTAIYFDVLRPQDRVAVKPHASPVFHAIQYLLG